MNKTKIDWKDLGFSWNPIVGCANGCPYCYAKKLSNRFKMIPDFTKPVFFRSRLFDPYLETKPSTIFVGSMCDIFSEGVEDAWIDKIRSVVYENPRHTFMFLTKNPKRYKEFKWYSNCILGTTIEAPTVKNLYERYDEFRFLVNYKKFLSIEPILGDFTGIDLSCYDQVIIGADSTPGAKVPPLQWIRSVKHHNIWYKKNLREHYPELINKF
jgi:protein gp37